MNLKIIKSNEFNEFSKKSKYSNFYQTGFYGSLMKKQGFEDIYLVLEDNGKYLCGGLFIIEEKKNSIGSIKYAYSPRGFIIDFYDIDLLNIFTKEIKKFFSKINVSFVRIDPPINHKFRDESGKILENQNHNDEIIIALQTLGYEHLGFSLYFETLKPRWNSIIKRKSSKNIYDDFNNKTKEKIKIAKEYDLKLIETDQKDINVFYDLIKKDHTKKIDYFENLFNVLKQTNIAHLFFVKLEPIIYLNKAKEKFEQEEKNNNNLVERFHKGEDVLEEKIVSDRSLSEYKQQINISNKLISKYPDGLIIGAALVINYNNEIYFMNEGYNNEFDYMGTKEFLKWGVIQNYNVDNQKTFNLNGIPGEFEKNRKYNHIFRDNQSLGATVSEYIGEFDLIINLPIYNMFRVVPPLKQYLKK